MPSRNWDEWNSSWVVSNLLDEVADFLGDFLKSGLAVWWLSGVHLVTSNNELLVTRWTPLSHHTARPDSRRSPRRSATSSRRLVTTQLLFHSSPSPDGTETT